MGLLFGFLLQKERVLRYDKQLGALRLKDMIIIKFMLSSVIVGMIAKDEKVIWVEDEASDDKLEALSMKIIKA